MISRAVWAVSAGLLMACASRSAPQPPPSAKPSLFLPDADFQLFVQPQELARDGQPLSLSAAQAEGASIGLGKILVASERVRVHTQRGADGRTNVGMSIEGAPASLGPDDVVDAKGERLLVSCRVELPVPCYRDLAPDDTPRRLYLLERRSWFVAAGGAAIAHAEAALRRGGGLERSATPEDRVIWQATYLGASLRRTIPKLRAGPLAPLAEGLTRVRMVKERRKNVMEVVASYDTAAAAEEAEPLASRVLSAWSRTRQDPRERLVSITRSGAQLRVLLRGELSESVPVQPPQP